MRKIKIGVLLGAALLCAQTVIAQSWQFVGPHAMGMGGAATIVNIAGAGTGSYKDNETVAMADVAAFGEAAIKKYIEEQRKEEEEQTATLFEL